MSKQASVIDVNNLLNIVQRRCDDFGVSVTFSARAQTASTNGKQIILPTPRSPISNEALDNLYGFVIHECGHHKRPEAFDILNRSRPPEHLCALFNIIEDDGMERERALEWKGDRKALATMNSNIIRQVSEQWREHLSKGNAVAQPPEPLAALALGQLSRLNWDDVSETAVTHLIKALPQDAKDLISDLIDEGWVDKFRATDTPKDTWNVAVDLAKRLYPNENPDEYEQVREAGNKAAEGEKPVPRGTENDTFSDAQGRTPDKQEGDEVASNGDMGDSDEEAPTTEEGEGRVISWKDAVISEHNEWAPQEGTPGTIGFDWKGYKVNTQGVCIMPTNMVNVVDLSKSKHKPSQYEYSRYLPTDTNNRQFANRMRRYIQAQARSTVDKEKYHGKLDKSALVRLALPPIDGGEYNKRIFYDQRKHTMKDTAIFVLTDWSGSMCGTKMRYAADASQRLVYVFDRVLNVPVALAAFSNGRSQCDIGYIKKYNTRGISPEAIAKRFQIFSHWCSANDDADALNWAWHEILKRKEHRKILIVLSDGAPTSAWRGHADSALRVVAKAIEQDGRTELYGVGIMSDAVENYYTNNIVLRSAAEINSTLFNIIKDGNNVKSNAA